MSLALGIAVGIEIIKHVETQHHDKVENTTLEKVGQLVNNYDL